MLAVPLALSLSPNTESKGDPQSLRGACLGEGEEGPVLSPVETPSLTEPKGVLPLGALPPLPDPQDILSCNQHLPPDYSPPWDPSPPACPAPTVTAGQ